MESRNKELIDIAAKIGLVGDYSSSSRNDILKDIADTYGAIYTKEANRELLRSIDAALNGSAEPQSRNTHIKNIAENLGATGLTDQDSRNKLLSAWASVATIIITVWILSTGSWDDSGFWDDSDLWIDGV